ncbi:low molecular weight phosphatase family protein [Thermus scotoductus]|uniref:Low molecular weight phosphatase family protein n=1 Tax=Thermus scotoductus TaxID=37636 RepID=A0A430URM5_THESC|nr:arsenate reductase ArsC [Thermus scotoductus]RTH39267.1 low molecular weight phosphatase family protein [Thermus scotoductus]RTI10893.1 low molecular weight phosphatase family protein [Thermus scotoductus]
MRLLVLCTHNSARSQMAEGWLRHWAREMGVDLEVHSAGTEKTFVKEEAKRVMAEVGISLEGHVSKTLFELPDPWNFHLVLTVCDAAKEACPAYPAKTEKRHVSFPDPSGKPVEEWRRVRDALGRMSRYLVENLKRGRIPTDEELREASGL